MGDLIPILFLVLLGASVVAAARGPSRRDREKIGKMLSAEGLEPIRFSFVPLLRFGRSNALIYAVTVRNPYGNMQKRYFAVRGLTGALNGGIDIEDLGSSLRGGEPFS